MDRALSFGAVADLYDRVRPTYPDALIDDLAAALPGPTVVEVGAGTGKATGKLLSRGLRVTCLEPDPAMAAVLARRSPPPERIVVTRFEAWTPDARYDGVVSAQAWHWTDPATRLDRAAAALRPGGLLALFWNVERWDEDAQHQAIDAVYEAHGIDLADRPMIRKSSFDGTGAGEIDGHPAFEMLAPRVYSWSESMPSDDFVARLNTTSHHRVMDEATRERLSAAIRRALGDRIENAISTHLFLGRRRAT